MEVERMNRRQALLLLALAAASPATYAQTGQWPDRPVRIVVPVAAGGGTDALARLLAARLSEEFGQQFIVENRLGAGGTIGAAFVARANPDGNTVAFVPAGYASASNPALYKLPFDPIKGIAPIALISTHPEILVVHPAVKANNLKELIELARANPGALAYGSAGAGGTFHLSAELFRQMTKIDMVHIPYKGIGPALTDLIAGQFQLAFSDLPATLPHLRSHRLRAIAVTSEKRHPTLPDVPTMSEVVPGYVINSWFGMWAPAGTPREIIVRFNEALGRILKRPDIQERLRSDGSEPAHSTPEEFARVIERDIELWARVVKDGNIKID
jgi:tripartite-type tricarboxylate transporter receptor subunit TctC